jgi:hypothetical protein
MISALIGLILGLVIAILPAILIGVSTYVSGMKKFGWVLLALIVPFVLKEIAFALVYAVQGPVMLNGYAPTIPLTWYISAWLIYFYFKKKHKPLNEIQT